MDTWIWPAFPASLWFISWCHRRVVNVKNRTHPVNMTRHAKAGFKSVSRDRTTADFRMPDLQMSRRDWNTWHKYLHCDVIKWKYFRVTGPLWGDTTGDRWIPLTEASVAELWCFLWSAPEQTVEQTVGMLVISDAIVLIMTSRECGL